MFKLPISLLQVDLILRARLIKAAIMIAFGAGIFLSPKLWINEGRFFPNLSLHDAVPILAAPFDVAILFLFVVLCIVWIFYEKRIVGWITIGVLTLILLQDQMRWQPWVYLYLLMLLPYLIQSSNSGNQKSTLICLQWTIAGVYIWSGIHKLNSGFLAGTFAQIIRTSEIGIELEAWKKVGYVIPFFEILIGGALFIPKFRKIGIYTAILTHVIILLYLSPIALNHNSVVYPWNIAMIFFVCLLYGGIGDDLLIAFREFRSTFFVLIPVVLVWVLPFLNFFGYWDHYLSFSLYSDKPSKFYIAVEKTQINKLDKKYEKYFAKIPGLQGGQLIDIDKWAFCELNVPFYPEKRLFRKLSMKFCELGINDDKLIFLELSYSGKKPHYNRFMCNDLESK